MNWNRNISFAVKGASVCALALVVGCSETNKAFSKSEMNRFVAAMVSVDCKVSFENAAQVEDLTGFSEEKLRAITDHLKETGAVIERKDTIGIQLIHKDCPNGK